MIAVGPAVLGLAGLAAGTSLWIGASRALRHGGPFERFLDGALIASWLAVAFFYLLAGLGVFHLWVVVAVLVGSGAVALAIAKRRGSPAEEPHDTALARPDVRDPWLWTALPTIAVVALRLIKGMAAPPMASDAMTTHLPKAALWIQSASLRLPDFPDAWSYYRWFPAAGDILFAWVMLPVRGDLLLAPFGVLVWILILVAGARLARELGAPDRSAWLGGAALAALPSVVAFLTATYVDNLLLLFMLLAATHAARFAQTGLPRNAVLGLGAAGLAIGTKVSALVMVAALVGTIAVHAWLRRDRLRGSFWIVMPAALMVPCAGYFHTWWHTGSPLYPFKAPLLPLPFHQALADLFSGRVLLPEGAKGILGQVFSWLFWTPPMGQGHMNFGLGGAILAATALGGIVLAVRRGGRAQLLWLTLAGAVLSTPLVFTDDNLALWTVWVRVLARHLLPALAPVLLWAAVTPARTSRLALSASLLLGMVHFFPLGWSPAMVRPALQIAAALTISIGAGLVLHRFSSRVIGPRLRPGLIAVLGVVLLSSVATIRARARYDIYREATREGGYDAHPPHWAFAMGASLWSQLDAPGERTIAVTVGKDKVGHNQFFYPLLGSRLQNRLIYIPISSREDESELEPADRYGAADPELWLTRLEEAPVDLVVGLWEPTPEREWLTAATGRYEVIALTNLGVPWVGRRRDGKAWPP